MQIFIHYTNLRSINDEKSKQQSDALKIVLKIQSYINIIIIMKKYFILTISSSNGFHIYLSSTRYIIVLLYTLKQ